MSRVKIGAITAVILVAGTGGAYFIETGNLDSSIRAQVEKDTGQAQTQLEQILTLESVGIADRARSLAADDDLAKGMDETAPDARKQHVLSAVQKFLGPKPKTDFVAVMDAKGDLLVADSPLPDADEWKTRFKAIPAALGGQTSKDIWTYGKTVTKVGIAPVRDPQNGGWRGVVVMGYGINAADAQSQAQLLGAELVYFTGDKFDATSLKRSGDVDELSKQQAIKDLQKDALAGKKSVIHATVGGDTYVITAEAMPLNFDDKSSGALILENLTAALDSVSSVKITILLLGLGALLILLGAIWVTSRLTLAPAEEIELGVNEIINGNVDYTFRPAGADFDGLANSLNVMLARLLGRPEPGEEDEEGEMNEGSSSRVLLEDDGAAAPLGPGAKMSQDPEILALAQENEADYYKRLFSEYLEARKAIGENVEGVQFEGFIAKLRLNEANLKKRYNSKAVRFRVLTKNGQVTLKPVPIL